MADFHEPIQNMRLRRTNLTLHGRSISRARDVSGHNVFKGYSEWARNGHIGVGDAIDLFGSAGEAVYAIADGVQTMWRNDATRLEVIYIEGDGWLAVYAHIDARHQAINVRVAKGEVVGTVRGDLSDPHLHFELWIGGTAVSARSSGLLRDRMLAVINANTDAAADAAPRLIVARPAAGHSSIDGLLYNDIPSLWDEHHDTLRVDTRALAIWLGKDADGLPQYEPIREALVTLGVEARFDLTHLSDPNQPRVYVFTT